MGVSVIAFRFVLRQKRPLIETRFDLSSLTRIDARLMAGSAIFGVGWGLAGYCRGPSIAALSIGSIDVLVFVAGMALGSLLCAWLAPQPAKAGQT